MKEISLTRGLVTLVDDEDYEWLSVHKWHVASHGYARRNVPHPDIQGKRSTLPMHRAIMGLDSNDVRVVDHIDGNRLNNQRSNLRVCLHCENSRNRQRHSVNKIGLKGVCKYKRKWKAQILSDGKKINLGYFKTPEEAHAAYRKAAVDLHGEFARFE